MTALSPDERRVLAVLTTTPQTLAQVADRAGLTSRRSAEAVIHELRHEGHPIVSSGRGVRLSDDPAEVTGCADSTRRRAIHQLLTSRALRRTAHRMVAALTPSYAVAEAPVLWGGPDAPVLWDERLGRSQGGEP